MNQLYIYIYLLFFRFFFHIGHYRVLSRVPGGQFVGTVCVCVCVSRFSRVQFFATLWTVAHQAPLSMGFSCKNTGVGCHALLQGIFLTQGSNLRLLGFRHWQMGVFFFFFLPLAPPGKLLLILSKP